MSFQPNSNIMNNYMNLFIQYCLMKNRKTYLENLGYNTAMINNMYNMMNNNMINNRNTTFMMNNMNTMNNNCMNNMNTCMMNNMNNTCIMNNMNNTCMMNNINNMNMNTCMMNNMNNNSINNMNMNTCMMNNMNNMNMNTCMMNNMNNMNMNTSMMNNMNNPNMMNNMNMNTCMMNNMNNNCMNNMNMNTCMMNNMNNNCMNNNRRFSMLNCMNNNNYLNMMNNNNFMNNLGNTWSCSDFKNNFNFNNNVDDLSNSFNNLNLNNTVNLSHVWNNPLSFSFNNINNPLMNSSNININSITNNQANGNNDEEEADGNNESINKDSEVTLKFTFMGSQTHLVKCKLNEKFSDVLERFKNEQCPDHFKNSLSVALHGGNTINPEKALYESGIKNNSIVLFIMDSEDLDEKDKKENETDKGEYKLTDDEIAIIRKWREEFDAMNFIKNILKKNNDSMDDFLEFVRNKEIQQVHVKEHKHKLVYLLSNYGWKCNKCRKTYDKKDAKFYCSICNYSLCEECHSKEKYDKKKVFPEGVKPSNKSVNIKFLETDYHEHRLIYCRSSRSAIGYNSWNCDNCRENHENDVWSFYCTNCDFDLCTKCAGFN